MPTSALDHLGAVPNATRSRAAEILAAVEAAGHRIHHVWGMGSSSEHASGRAVDFMVYVRNAKGVATSIDNAAGDFIRDYVWTHRDRLGLIHVLWEQHITSTRTAPGVRRLMADRGSPTENHMDHPHILFDESPYVAPRGEQAASRDEDRQPVKAPAPKPAPAGVDRAKTQRLQALLELAADGYWGDDTDEWALRMRTAARAHVGYPKNDPKPFREDLVQKVIDVTPDGIFGAKSKAALRVWVASAQRVLSVGADGVWGPGTDAAFTKFRTANHNKF